MKHRPKTTAEHNTRAIDAIVETLKIHGENFQDLNQRLRELDRTVQRLNEALNRQRD